MKIKNLVLTAVLGLTAITQTNAQILSELGSSASNLFTIDSDVTIGWTPAQTSSGIGINGTDSDGNQFGGSWANPFTLASNNGVSINITGTTPIPGSLFTVELYNSDFTQTKSFNGSFAQVGVTNNNYTLSFLSETSSFTSIGGFVFTSGGTGSNMNISVNNLSAVPEPSTYALLGIGAVGLFLSFRRRKA